MEKRRCSKVGKWGIYEARKRILQQKGLSPVEYEDEIKKLIKELKL